MRRLLATICFVVFAGGPAQAGEERLSAAEIEALLSGNTISGVFNGTPYTQTFAPDGRTVYTPEGGQGDEGKWRVDAEEDQYESWWASTGWTAYEMARDGGTLIFIASDGSRSTAELVESDVTE